MRPQTPAAHPETAVEQTLTELLVCRRAPRGCTWWVSFSVGQDWLAKRIRTDHEAHQCPLRELNPRRPMLALRDL